MWKVIGSIPAGEFLIYHFYLSPHIKVCLQVWLFVCYNRGDDLPKMGLLMVVLSLIFMSDHVLTECKYFSTRSHNK